MGQNAEEAIDWGARPTDQVDGVYVVLGGLRQPAEDYVDAVYMALAAAARTYASAALCSATHACAGKTFSEAGSWQPSCFRRRHVGLEPSRVPPQMEP